MARSFNEALTHARRAAAPRRVAAALALSITWGLGAPAAARAQGGAPNLQHTKNTPDLGLRSELKVDPSTLGMSVRIPLGSYPGRVGADLSFALQYNSKVWRVEFEDFVNGGLSGCSNSPEAEVGTECYTTTRALYGENSVAGWTFIGALPTIEAGGERYDASGRACCDGDPARGFYIPRLTVRFPDGSSHELRRGDAPLAGADPQTGTYYSVDSSRMKYVGASPGAGTLYMPDGSRYEFAGGAATRYVDSNGNVLTAQADTLGRQITAPSFHNGFAHTETRTLPGVGGAPMSYTFDLRELGSPGVLEPDMLTGQTPALRRLGDRQKFGNEVYDNALFSSVEGTRLLDPFTFNPVVLHRLTLPDGSAYTFTYNEYGEIAKVAYPAGGHERYRYGPVPSLTRLDAPYTQANRGVLERRVSAGGAGEGEAVWLYEGGGASVTSVAPDGTRTVRLNHTGYPFGSVLYGLDDPRAGMEYERRVYAPQSQGGAMLRRTLTEWGVAGPLPGGHPSAKRDPKVLRTVELLLDTGAGAPLARSTTYQYAQASQPLNVTAVTEHAFVEVARATAEGGPVGDIPAGAPLRTTETAYKDEPAYNERNMVALPVSVAVRAGGPGNGPSPGAVVARTEVYYDEASYAGADMSPLPCGATEGREATVPAARGNVTTTGRWLDTLGATDNPSAYLDAHARYDGCGSVRRTWEPAARGGLSARFAETEYSPDYQSAYPTRSLSAVPDPTGARGSNVPLETASVYDAATGLVLSVTDVNNQTTTGYSYHDPDTHAPDPLSRLRRVSLPDGGSTRYDYGAAPDNFYVRARTAIDASRSTDFYQFFDGLGRPSRAYSFDGGAPGRTWVAVKTQRDERTRTVKVSHPHFRTDLDDFDLDAAQGGVPFTTTASDPLGRVTSVLSPGGAAALTEYVGAEVTAADEAGVKRSSVTDALGRLERVVEAPGVEGYGYETTYEHDALGNLRKVTQGRAGQTRQTRLFAYDSLARLTSSVSPEGGASSFAYDAAGDLTRRTDARHVRADYSYDALHRPVGRSYSVEPGHAPPPGYAAAPPVAYFYDGRGMPSQGGAPAPAPAFSAGRLTAVKSSASETIYTEFDPAGRVKGHRQVADPGAASERAYLMEYGYDLAGNLTRQKYPSGKVVATEYDGAGRVAGVRDQAAGSYYAGGAAADPSGRIRYAAHGAAEAVRLGNGLWERASFNARLQTAEIALGSTPADADRLRLSYGYGPADRNNGDVRSQRIEAAGLDVTQVYEYDPVNRLLSAREAPTAGGADTWRQAYTYLDAAGRNGQFGNRRVDASGDPATGQPRTTANVAPQHNPTIDPATNRFDPGQGYGYDAAGNVTQDPAHAYAFDGENRLASVDGGWDGAAGVTFSYDGDGRRVRKASASEVTVFVYDCLGRLAAEYSNRVGHGGALYLTQDPLGSTRVLTDAQGNAHSGGGAAGARHDYLPFGEEIGASTGGRATIQGYSQADDTRQKWHTLERDDETGLDFAQARYYSSAQGRFTGVDPLMASGRASAPQTWNRYSYGYNNPLRFTDPNGMLAGDFYNQDGKRLGTDGVNDGKVYVVPDKAQAKQIEQADKRGGTTQASAVDSAVELPSLNVRTAIGAAVERSNSPTADDQKGGFHEEGLIAGPAVAGGQETVVNAAPGPYTDPGVPGAATIDVTNPANPAQAGILADITVMAHVHPGGELKSASGPGPGGGGMVIGGETITQTANFNQPPSSVDVQIAGARPGGITSIVVGARSKTVYIYNGSGVRATFPLKQFLNVGRK